VNWYKRSQGVQDEGYYDIGHYNEGMGDDYTPDPKGRKIALWQANSAGGQFEVKEFDLHSDPAHDKEFASETDEYGNEIGRGNMYQGRYDPIKKKVTINMPYDPKSFGRIMTADEIPNRLIGQLESRFSEAESYKVFGYGSPTKEYPFTLAEA